MYREGRSIRSEPIGSVLVGIGRRGGIEWAWPVGSIRVDIGGGVVGDRVPPPLLPRTGSLEVWRGAGEPTMRFGRIQSHPR